VKYLFALEHAYAVPVIGPLIAHLDREGRSADCRMLVTGEASAHVPAWWGRERLLADHVAARRFAPDFVLTAENAVDFRIPGIKVQLFHGVGVEKASHYAIRHFFDVYCTSGPLVTARFRELARTHGYFRVEETGWPKFDHIIATRPPAGACPYRRDGVRAVVLYAPTFSRRLQSADALAATLPDIIRDDECWLLKFHELMPQSVVEHFRQLGRSNVVVLGPGDITPALHAADVMISDTSSVVYEFLALGKPVVTFRAGENVTKALNVERVEALRPAIDLLLAEPDYGRTAREAILQQVNPYLHGQVAANVFAALTRVYAEGLPSGASKPLNLFRKAKYLWRASRPPLLPFG
jgi:CDP-glycerol glycerophosphotransferase (TagB/SpsB family)